MILGRSFKVNYSLAVSFLPAAPSLLSEIICIPFVVCGIYFLNWWLLRGVGKVCEDASCRVAICRSLVWSGIVVGSGCYCKYMYEIECFCVLLSSCTAVVSNQDQQ